MRTCPALGYGMYILQTPIHALSMGMVALATGAGIAGRPGIASSPWFVLAYVIVLGGCTFVSLRWYEVPARTAIRRLAERVRGGESQHAAAMPGPHRKRRAAGPPKTTSRDQRLAGYRSA